MRRFKTFNIPNLKPQDIIPKIGDKILFQHNMLRISGIVKESITDGPGLRLAIFTQGCPHACPGCHNPETHSVNAGINMSVTEIIEMIAQNHLLQGITLSGGEPMMQPEALLCIAKAAHQYNLNVMCYTGYVYEYLIKLASQDQALANLLDEIDCIVDGPFILAKRNLELDWRGSVNQRIITLTAEGKKMISNAHMHTDNWRQDLVGKTIK